MAAAKIVKFLKHTAYFKRGQEGIIKDTKEGEVLVESKSGTQEWVSINSIKEIYLLPFQVGDKVQILIGPRKGYHPFQKGEVVEVFSVNHDKGYVVLLRDNMGWNFSPEEIKKV